MALKNKIQSIFNVIVAGVGLFITFYTVMDLMFFLSDPNYKNKHLPVKNNNWLSILWSLLIDMVLLSGFILPHTLLALPNVKNRFNSLGLHVTQRSIYVAVSSLALQGLLMYWQDVSEVSLWKFNTNSKVYWWSFLIPHIFAWAVIYVGSICMDVNELVGVKQVYYDIRNLPDPNAYKSHELKRLYSHVRHPSFTAFLIIFWAIPVMSLDRLLLSTVMTSYMYLAWNTDQADYRYQKLQFDKKFHELNYVRE